MDIIPVPLSSYRDPYIPVLSSLWCHRGNTQPGKQTEINIKKTFNLCLAFVSRGHVITRIHIHILLSG